MKLKKPKNINYCATVVKIEKLIPLGNCDNVLHALIFGNLVIVTKKTKVGEIGIFFPIETQLSKEFLFENNLYRDPTLNKESTKKGFFEINGRVKCVKFRGNNSEGFYIPINCVDEFLNPEDSLNVGDEFDELNGVKICQKYIPKNTKVSGTPGKKKSKKAARIKSKLIDNQFRFHDDTGILYKNLHRIYPDSLISITYKLHGTSGISSKILCKKKLSLKNRILKKLGVDIVDTHYDYIYSSRKVIKNEELNPNANHYYGVDIWSLAHEQLKPYLQDGMTFYYEIVGYLPSGSLIQKDYDYGANENEAHVYIYRITYTNPSGKVFEFSAKQVQNFCVENGLNAVPELYYGTANSFTGIMPINEDKEPDLEKWRNHFLGALKTEYNDKDCYMCSNKVPEEGCVVRIENNSFEAYKVKSNRFYLQESSLLDQSYEDIESLN